MQRLGDGAFGAVCTVYNDNGDVYAMKMFDEDEDDATLDHGTIVEVSMLRCPPLIPAPYPRSALAPCLPI